MLLEVGKLDGPEFGIVSWWDYIFIILIFTTRAATLFLVFFFHQLSFYNIQQMAKWLDITYDDITSQFRDWFWCIIHKIVVSTLGQYLWFFLVTSLQVIFCGPIVIYSLYKSIYEFGPVQ